MMSHRYAHRRLQQNDSIRRGIILIVVLVVVVIISLAGFSFVAFMFTENKGVRLRGDELQAGALVDSGEEYLKLFLEQTAGAIQESGGAEDNPDRFRAVAVIDGEESGRTARFSVLSTRETDEEFNEPVFGAESESGRLNLAAVLDWDRRQPGAGQRALLALPGMTSGTASAILDWIDPDASEREGGAETEYYAGLDPPYAPRNALPESFEELLLVKGVTRALLFGAQTAGDGDATFDDRGDSPSSPKTRSRSFTDSSPSQVPWASLLTWRSAERNVNRDGEQRININSTDLSALHKSLNEVFDEKQSRFIVLYRQYGPSLAAATPADDSAVNFNPAVPAKFPIDSVLDLIDARVSIPAAVGSDIISVASPFTSARDQLREYLPKLLDDISLDGAKVHFGRVNINSALPAVLSAIPGIDGALVEQILMARRNRASRESTDRSQPGWLLIDGLVDIAKLRAILPYITCRGDVHRAEIVGFFDDPGPMARREVLIDATARPARLVYWKDLRSQEMRYSPEMLGTEESEREREIGTSAPRPLARRRNNLTQASPASRSSG